MNRESERSCVPSNGASVFKMRRPRGFRPRSITPRTPETPLTMDQIAKRDGLPNMGTVRAPVRGWVWVAEGVKFLAWVGVGLFITGDVPVAIRLPSSPKWAPLAIICPQVAPSWSGQNTVKTRSLFLLFSGCSVSLSLPHSLDYCWWMPGSGRYLTLIGFLDANLSADHTRQRHLAFVFELF